MNVVSLTGDIAEGDSDRFDRIAAQIIGKAVVFLESNGGLSIEAMAIGETIRSKGFSTMVGHKTACASACGLIWLAGLPRYASETGSIGFHGVYKRVGDNTKESSTGNAFVGAYLAKLGLSYSAVAFVTAAAPTEMNWLKASDTAKLGIKYVAIAEPAAQPPPPPKMQSDMSPAQQAASTTTAYVEGRQARIEYERWFTGLPDGAYRDGAVFWASNRSLKPPPNCYQPNTTSEWQTGCAAGRLRLALVDVRRTEKNYWWGWNSL
jgi:hypothetical protein